MKMAEGSTRGYAFPGWTLALLLAAATPAYGAGEIQIVETQAILVEQSRATLRPSHGLQLSLYVFRGARWSPDEVAAAALESARMLG